MISTRLIVLPLWASKFLQQHFDTAAICLSHRVILLTRAEYLVSTRLLRHEFVHVRQSLDLGWRYMPVYLWLWSIHGYANHPMEQEACEKQDDGPVPTVTHTKRGWRAFAPDLKS